MKKAADGRQSGARSQRRGGLLILCAASCVRHTCFWLMAAGFWLLASAMVAQAFDPTQPEPIPKLRPPRGEIPPSLWEQHGNLFILLAPVFLVFILALTWYLFRPKPPVPVPPQVRARRELEYLQTQPETGALLSRVSQVLRHYLAAAFTLPPDEMTTTEFCREVSGQGRIGTELVTQINTFLRQCDELKFAPPQPRPASGAATQAIQLVDRAEQRRITIEQAASVPETPRPRSENERFLRLRR